MKAGPPAWSRGGLWALFRRYFTPLSAGSLVGVVLIFALCVVLWDVAWLRPYLAAGGAGLAAFLGPIPGIISPEARSKWLASIVIAAAITVGTWMATRDISDRLAFAEQARVQHDDFMRAALAKLGPEARPALFTAAARPLWSLYKQKEDYVALRDMALMLLEVERENGHALYFAGQAYWQLGDTDDMFRMFQHYVSVAADEPEAQSGDANECYLRASGFCAERLGWVSHLLADAHLTQAQAQTEPDETGATLALVVTQETRALELKKWGADHHNPGFDFDKKSGARSSCSILQTVAREQERLGIDASKLIAFGKTTLGDACPRWPR